MGNTFMSSRDGPVWSVPRPMYNTAVNEVYCAEFAGRLLSTLAHLRRDAVFCDVLLQAENEAREDLDTQGLGDGEASGATVSEAARETGSVWAHSVVLAAASPYFFEIFSKILSNKGNTKRVIVVKGLGSVFVESSQTAYFFPTSSTNIVNVHGNTGFLATIINPNIINVKNMKLETLRALVENIYSPVSLTVPVEDAKALLAAATRLAVEDVRDEACSYLARSLTAENALGIRASAELNSCAALAAAATRYIHYYGDRVLEGDELLDLDFNTLNRLLKNSQLAAREECVFDAVLRWIRHHPQERRKHLASLQRAVHLPLVPRSVLAERACIEPLSSEPQALIHIIKALTENRERAEPPTRPRLPRNTLPPIALLVIGGWLDDTGCTSSVLVCSLPGHRWQSAASMPEPRDNAAAALLDGRVYVVGGREAKYSHVRSVFVYDTAMDSWSWGPPLRTARGWLGAAALAGQLYAVGGLRGIEWFHTEVFKSAEVLDPREGVWRQVAPMRTRRSGLGVAALDGSLYAIGGFDGDFQLNSTERYDPVAGKWEIMESMKERRDDVRVAVLDDTLYAVGGRDDRWRFGFVHRLRSVERYRAGSGWETAPAMPASQGNAAVAAHGGRLYAAGGHNGRKRLTAVSVFDPVIAAWSELPVLPEPRSAAVAAAVVAAWSSSSVP